MLTLNKKFKFLKLVKLLRDCFKYQSSIFRGLKARPVSPSEKPFWEALEASPVSMDTEQVYTVFQQGMVNAMWTVPSTGLT